jgi:hypothetical protein
LTVREKGAARELPIRFFANNCPCYTTALRTSVIKGFISGDPERSPQSAEKVAALLEEPSRGRTRGLLKKLEGTPAPGDDWPDIDTEPGFRFWLAGVMFEGTAPATRSRSGDDGDEHEP